MPRLVTQKKKRAPKRKSTAVRYGRTKSDAAITTYMPYFRRMYAARNFTRLKMGGQGFIDSNLAGSTTTGFWTIASSELQVPFSTANPFTGAQNGSGIYTSSTGVNNYQGYSVMTQQWNAWRIHRRRLSVECIPTVQGDQVAIMTYPSQIPTAPGFSSNVVAGQPYSKVKMVGFSGNPGKLYNNQSGSELSGLTKLQWECLPPTQVGTAPAAATLFYDVIGWSTIDGGRLVANLVFLWNIEIDVEFSDPLPQVQ